MKKFLIGVVIVLIVLVGIGFLLPTDYAIERSIVIQAKPDAVHKYIGDLKKWPEWQPWEEEDPTIVTTLGEKTTGVGASQTWTSDQADGELMFTASDPATGIAYDMAFIMAETRAPSTCEMTYEVSGDTVIVTWTMQGDFGDMLPPVIGGYMTPVFKGTIGTMFDRGLEKLKTEIETES